MLKCVGDKERMPRGRWRMCVQVFVHKSVFHKMKNTVIRKRNVFCEMLTMVSVCVFVPQQSSTYAQSIIFPFVFYFHFYCLHPYLVRGRNTHTQRLCFHLVYCEKYILEDLNCFYGSIVAYISCVSLFFCIFGVCIKNIH